MPLKIHRTAKLAPIDLPDFGTPTVEPGIGDHVYAGRLETFVEKLRTAGADAAVIYADREHAANMTWLTGFDPRFEEALLIVRSGRQPVLFTGPENQGAAQAAPLSMAVRLYPPMGLMGQAREDTSPLADMFADAGLDRGQTIGVCGWKYFGPLEHADHRQWMEIPAYIVDTLRQFVGKRGAVFNAGALFMDPADGLRSRLTIDELARFEFAACHTSEAVKRVVLNTRPGMREYEAATALQPIGKPLSCHPMFTSGERAWHGLLSPGSRMMEQGDAVTTAYGVQGALNCRAGWLAADAGDLLPAVQDYVDVLVVPYFEAIAEWLETIETGVAGGVLDAIIRKRLGDPFFGIKLNPGHLIHLEEWMHSPIVPQGKVEMRSGMAVQLDVIPATGSGYFTTNIEDGIALLDQYDRAVFAERYPKVMARIEARRQFMDDALGIHLKPDVLPFSNLAGWLPPFWLSPDQAMTLR